MSHAALGEWSHAPCKVKVEKEALLTEKGVLPRNLRGWVSVPCNPTKVSDVRCGGKDPSWLGASNSSSNAASGKNPYALRHRTIWAPWLSELGEGSVGISSTQVFCQICFRPDVAPQLPLVDNKLPSP